MTTAPSGLVDAARGALVRGDLEATNRAAAAMVAASPEDAEGHFLLGVAEAGVGRIKAGIGHIERAVTLDPRGEYLAHLAKFYCLVRRDRDAANALRRAEAAPPADALGRDTMGCVFARLGDHAAALPHFAEAVRLRPDIAEYRYNEAVTLNFLGRVEEAEAAIEALLAQAPGHARAHHLLAGLRRQSAERNHVARLGEVTVGRGVAVPPPDIAPPVEDEPEQPGPVDPPALSAAAILPQAEVRDDGYAAMTAFVLAAAEAPKGKKERRSALLDQKSLAGVPRMTDCAGQRGALLVDLDPGEKPFDLTDPPAPAPGLADRLRAIRGTGTAVVWIATLPESASRDLANLLAATGLDPLGIDGMLLLRGRETRKQELLNRAGEDWCVLAIAGDRKADFDEVFDYLRNPDGPVALALEQHIGAGWFLVPPPIR